MNSNPLVSVIIPAYNSEDHLERAIESVLSQSHQNIECIVINDGSTDKTEQVSKKYRDRIIYIYQKNSGVSSARNSGITAAKGEYIAFLDADDYWKPSKIEWQVKIFCENSNLSLISTERKNHEKTDNYKEILTQKSEIDRNKVHLQKDFQELFKNPYLTTSTVMIKASILKNIGGFDESLTTAEDIDLYFKCCWGHSFAKIKEPLVYKENLHESLGNKTRTYKDNIFVIDKLLDRNPDFKKEFKTLVDEKKLYIYSRWVEHLIYFGEGTEARKVLSQSLAFGIPPKYFKLFLKSYIAKFIFIAKNREKAHQ